MADKSSEELRTLYDVAPMKRALQYVVQESQKHAGAGNNDQFVAVGRICHAVLKWQEADERGDFEAAEDWLSKVPR